MAIPIGLQLYSIREDCKTDLAGSLAEVARMGYAGVEFAGYYNRSADELRDMLDDLNLRCCGTHTKLDTLLGGELNRTADFNETLGNKFLIVPAAPKEMRESLDGFRKLADQLAEIADKLAGRGMLTGYHTHAFDVTPIDGQMPWKLVADRTPANVVMQLDTGNAMAGGADPVALINAYPGRAQTVHLKGYQRTGQDNWAFAGEGDVDWAGVFEACQQAGKTEWYIVEQESYPVPPLQCAQRCLDSLRKRM